MAVTIDTNKISGIGATGGNPPTHIRVAGTVTGCEWVYVLIKGCSPEGVAIPIKTGGLTEWSIDVPNKSCVCGQQNITVEAWCGSGAVGSADASVTITLTCDCPSGTIVIADVGECVNGMRTVTFNATVAAPQTAAAVGQWNLNYTPPGGSPLGKLFVVPVGATHDQTTNTNLEQTWTYPPGNYTVFLDVSAVHPGCPNPSLTFTVAPCPITCEVLLDYAPKPVPCIPSGGFQRVDFEAKLNPPDPSYTGPFIWEVTKAGISVLKVTQCVASQVGGCAQATFVPDPHKFSYTFNSLGSYDVTVTILTPLCPHATDSDQAHIDIESCCPTGKLNAQVNPDNPCQWFFWVDVDNPNASMTFDWKFSNDGKTENGKKPSSIWHTYAVGSITNGETEVTMHADGCPAVTLTTQVDLAGCFCPTVGTPTAVVSGAPGPTAVTFSTSVSPPIATSFRWTVTTPAGVAFTKTTSAPSTTDGTSDGSWTDNATGSMGPLDLTAPGSYAVTVSATGSAIPASCPPTAPRPFTVPTRPSSNGGFDWCCFLVGAWAVVSVIFAVLSYYSVYSYPPVGTIIYGAVGAIAAILLVLWIIFCCWPCALTFWRCCVFLQWQWLAATWAASLLGILEAACKFLPLLCGNTTVLGIYSGYVAAVLLVLSAAGNCGRLPNPIDPRTWPPCRC